MASTKAKIGIERRDFLKKVIALLVIASGFLAGCATMVRIDTNVPGADVNLNGQAIGKTPVTQSLDDFIGTNYYVVITKDGYQTLRTTLNKEFKVGTFIGGLFLWPLLLWTYGPSPFQTFDLQK